MENPPDQSKPGPPSVPKGAVRTPIPQSMIARAIDGLRGMVYRRAAEATPPPPTDRPVAPSQVAETPLVTSNGFMNPGRAQRPITEAYEDVAGRAFDFPAGYNTSSTVRQWEGVSLTTLRNIAENYDLLRLAIETRKDQVSKLKWSIMPRKEPGATHPPKANDACREVETCLRCPDGIHSWDQWIRMIAEDSFVLDGVALYRRRYPDGKPYALEVVDAATIQPLIDITGRSPLPPAAAYNQLIKGSVAAQYTRNELTYWRRNPRSHKVYGYSPVEQIVRTTMLGLGRLAKQVGHYADGNMPDLLIQAPATWAPQQIREFQTFFDLICADPATRAKARFLPGGMGQPIMINGEAQLFGPFDEWLARMICYAFSLPPFPFIKETNRSTAEASYDSALAEGLGSFISSLKGLHDREIADFYGHPELELVWDDERKLDPTEQAAKDQSDFRTAFAGHDEIRVARGLDPLGIEPLIFGIGPMGFVTVQQLKQIIAQNSNMPPPPGMGGFGGPPGFGGGRPGFGGPPGFGGGGQPGMDGGEDDPLANADPRLLAQLGMGSSGAGVPPGEVGPAAAVGASGGPTDFDPTNFDPVQPGRGEVAAGRRMKPLPAAQALLTEMEAKLAR